MVLSVLAGIVCLSAFFTADLKAQATDTLKIRLHPVRTDSSYFLGSWILADRLEIRLNHIPLDSSLYTFRPGTGRLLFRPAMQEQLSPLDTVYITAPRLRISQPSFYRPAEPEPFDEAMFTDEGRADSLVRSTAEDSYFSDSDLRQSGSLSRGIIVGSNQDFALESGLNFELNGKLTEDVEISASLTDQNIPIQPEGTTQNLREFDRVYINLRAPQTQIEMGDVDISLQQSYFARLNRRVQGAAAAYHPGSADIRAAMSVSRGIYKSLEFTGEEGVQGPYRLTGEGSDEFIIILAGTEQVYIDGQLMQRGVENDYIIDYGLGEITFTTNRLIREESRIVVEYEYIDRDFNRTLVAGQGQESFLNGRLTIGATAIRQADDNNLLSQQSLSEEDIEQLKQAGDNTDSASGSTAEVIPPDERENYIMYVQKDTTLNGEVYSIFEHRPGDPDAIYRVRFSKNGQGGGDYIRTSTGSNGLVYEWAGPGQGNYSPFRKLPAPEKQQMVAFNGSYRINEHLSLQGEMSFSDLDRNRFSALDDDDNSGLAYDASLRLDSLQSGLGEFNAYYRKRYFGQQFSYFDRVKEVEFDRTWNVESIDGGREDIQEAGLEIEFTPGITAGGEFGTISRVGFEGIRQASHLQTGPNAVAQLRYRQDWVQSDNNYAEEKGDWLRQQLDLSKAFKAGSVTWTPFIYAEGENRVHRDKPSDSLKARSLEFYEFRPGLRMRYGIVEAEAGIGIREEQRPSGNSLEKAYRALEQNYRLNLQPGPGFRTENTIRIRDKDFTESFEAEGSSDRKALLIRSVTDYRTSDRLLEGNLFYRVNTERKALLQESYINVGPETGQYVWEDLNGDGTQQIDEFFPELSVNEGQYIRRFLPSDDFRPVIDLEFRFTNSIRLLPFLDREHSLSNLKWNSTLDIRENSTTGKLADVYLMRLNTFRNDSLTIQGRMYNEQELDFFPDDFSRDLRIGYRSNRALNSRSSEQIRSETQIIYLNGETGIAEQSSVNLEVQAGKDERESTVLASRNYSIYSILINPGFRSTLNRSWNTGFNISFEKKEDRYPEEVVNARTWKLVNTNRAYLWKKVQATTRLELRNTLVDGSSSAYGSYELTGGAGEGTNLIWSLNGTYRLSNLIRMSLNYDGRTVKNRPAIHTIKLVMSALF